MMSKRKVLFNGELITRGEFVSAYEKNDEVHVMKEEGNLLHVVFLTGVSTGNVACIDKKIVGEN